MSLNSNHSFMFPKPWAVQINIRVISLIFLKTLGRYILRKFTILNSQYLYNKSILRTVSSQLTCYKMRYQEPVGSWCHWLLLIVLIFNFSERLQRCWGVKWFLLNIWIVPESFEDTKTFLEVMSCRWRKFFVFLIITKQSYTCKFS